MKFEVSYEPPAPEDYCALRLKAGLSRHELKAAAVGLKNSLFSVVVKNEGQMIGMGRVIGDGGCFAQITDIAVTPVFQGQGVGSIIMKEIMKYVRTSLPPTCFVNLFADVDFLYQKYGFVDSKKSKGMYLDWSRIPA